MDLANKVGTEQEPSARASLTHRELVLVHRNEERKLDPKRVGLFLKAVHSLWRNPVRLRANSKVYSYDRRGFSST